MKVPRHPPNNAMANDSNRFVMSRTPDRHEVNTPAGPLVLYVKPLSWIEQQEAISQFVEFKTEDGEMKPSIDLGGYWKYVMTRCIERTEPSLTESELLNVTPEVGAAIQTVLPGLEDLITTFMGGEPSPLE